MKKRFISFLLIAAMFLSMIPVCVNAVETGTYLDYDYNNGTFAEKTIPDGVLLLSESVTGTSKSIGETGKSLWYLADESMTFTRHTFDILGDVHLILKDGVSITFNYGVDIEGSNSLTIYAQSSDAETAGGIISYGDMLGAGIGSSEDGVGGKLVINGGNILAVGDSAAPGIGAGYASTGFVTEINGGNIIAKGGEDAPGIGSGFNAISSLTIHGGRVSALGGEEENTGKDKMPAIGTGISGECDVQINYCTFDMLAGDSEDEETKVTGYNNQHHFVLEKRDNLIHTCKREYPLTYAVPDENGNLLSYGHLDYYECYCGKFFKDKNCTEEIDNINAWKNGEGKVSTFDKVKVTFDLNYDCTERYFYQSRNVKDNIERPNDPQRENYSFIGWYTTSDCTDGTLYNFDGFIAKDITLYAKWIFGGYIRYSNGKAIEVPLPEGIPSLTKDMTSLGTDGQSSWFYADTSFVCNTRLQTHGNVNVILKDGVTIEYTKGINVDKSYRGFAVYAQSTDKKTMGTLKASAGEQYSAIGSGDETDCGTITIMGGNIIAHGGKYGAGIGGGDINNGGEVDISGGYIEAYGGERGAGIGTGEESGKKSAGGLIVYITGGEIHATGGKYAAGIGGGNLAKNFDVYIKGGTVYAEGGTNGAGIGSGSEAGGDTTANSHVYITGGVIEDAKGGDNAAGIGSGYKSKGIKVFVSGGTINNVNGGSNSAAVGAGNYGFARVTLAGGIINNATAGTYGAGIGAGSNGSASALLYGGEYYYAKGYDENDYIISDEPSKEVYPAIGAGKNSSCDVIIDYCKFDNDFGNQQPYNGETKIRLKFNDSNPHEYKTKHYSVPPVYDASGNIKTHGYYAYYECECGMFFEDKACTKPIGDKYDIAEWKIGEATDFDGMIMDSINDSGIPVHYHWGGNITTIATDWYIAEYYEPDYPSHYLLGWYTDEECTQKFNFGESIFEELHLYSKWTDDFYLTYNSENCKFECVMIPEGTITTVPQKVNNRYTLGVGGKTTWYYFENSASFEDTVYTYGDVNIILKDNTTLTFSKGISVVSGSYINIYAQSQNKNIMGKMNVTGITDNHSTSAISGASSTLNIYGGNITAVGGASLSGSTAFGMKKTSIYGGYLDLTGGNSSAWGMMGEAMPTFALGGEVYVNNCLINIYDVNVTNGQSTLIEKYNNNRHVVFSMKEKIKHKLKQKHDIQLPYATDDGVLVHGYKEYYECDCGHYFTDAGFSVRIDDLEYWKNHDGKITGVLVTYDYGYDGIVKYDATVAWETIKEPENPVRPTYDFVCWLDSNGNRWNFKRYITSDTKLTAKWELGHVHNWSDEWTFDSEYHWHECTADPCPDYNKQLFDGYSEHTFENYICSVCGYVDLATAKIDACTAIDEAVIIETDEVLKIVADGKAAVNGAGTLDEVFAERDKCIAALTMAYSTPYLDENGDTKYVIVPEDNKNPDYNNWESGWYYVSMNIIYDEPLVINGNINLILADGITLTANKGISLVTGNSMTVFAQSSGDDMGQLIATGDRGAAGIGGDFWNFNAGDLTLNGGVINATGGMGAAGIGGGFGGNGGKVVVNGGIIEAVGGIGNNSSIEAAGIGGGYAGECGEIVINNVTLLVATGGKAFGAGLYAQNAKSNITVDKGLLVTSNGKPVANNEIGTETEIIIIPDNKYTGISLTLDSEIFINFYMELTEDAVQNGNMVFTVGNRTVESKVQLNEDNGKYYFTCPLNALEMAEDVIATFTYCDRIYEMTYSVEKYVDTILAGSYSDEMKNLARKIANYGYYAQIYLDGIHTNVTIGEGGYAEMEHFGGEFDIDVEKAKVALKDSFVTPAKANGTSLYGRTAYLDSAIALNYYVTVDDGKAPTVVCNDKRVEIEKYKNSIYIVSIKDITATELADKFTVTINGVEFTGSVFDYCGAVITNNPDNSNAAKAMAALYEYYDAAVKYAESKKN